MLPSGHIQLAKTADFAPPAAVDIFIHNFLGRGMAPAGLDPSAKKETHRIARRFGGQENHDA